MRHRYHPSYRHNHYIQRSHTHTPTVVLRESFFLLHEFSRVLESPINNAFYCVDIQCRPQVLATNGDTHLGGEDFDQRVMQYFIKMLKKKNGTDLTGDNRALQKLRREVRYCPFPILGS